jgi:hypothetical protein
MPIALAWNIATLLQIVTILLFEDGKRRKPAASFVGILDGLRGKWGTFAERWPKL